MDKLKGRPGKASADTRLSDLGISYDQSSQWQKLGAISQAHFDTALEHVEKNAVENFFQYPIIDLSLMAMCPAAFEVAVFPVPGLRGRPKATRGASRSAPKARADEASSSTAGDFSADTDN
jgi:hypothetical protein